jgi:hypothetical protein
VSTAYRQVRAAGWNDWVKSTVPSSGMMTSRMMMMDDDDDDSESDDDDDDDDDDDRIGSLATRYTVTRSQCASSVFGFLV